MFYISRFSGIDKKEYDCEIVTPMFLGGADTRKAELRVPPIKGALRFWWRALNPQNINDLKKKESAIFGDAGDEYGKSKLKIGICGKAISLDSYPPLPHHNTKPKNFNVPCIKEGSFKISVFGTENEHPIFRLFSFLGGLGKRSRRGFGSFKITNPSQNVMAPEVENIYNLINQLLPGQFTKSNTEITRTIKITGIDYAFIEKIFVGKPNGSVEYLLKGIGQASHDCNCDYLGFAKGQERFASPVYVTVNKNDKGFYPVITLLHNAPKNPLSGPDKTKEFIERILAL